MRPVTEVVTEFDERIEKWLEPRRSATLDDVMYGVSSAADHALLWLAFGAVRTVRRNDLAWGGRYLGMLVGESAVTNTVKLMFRRVRPQEHFSHDDPLPHQMRRPITSSFPSGHAVTAFTAAAVLSRGEPPRAALLRAGDHHCGEPRVHARPPRVGRRRGRRARRRARERRGDGLVR